MSKFIAAMPTCEIVFDDEASPLCGLEVVMRTRATVADLIRLGQAWQGGDPDEMGAAADSVGRYLVRWNLEEPDESGDGSTPVPATEAGWVAADAAIKMLVFQRWMDAINGAGGHVVDPKSSTPSSSFEPLVAQPEMTGVS